MRRTSELLPPTQAGAKVGNIFVVEKARHNRSMIATVIGLHQSTISRELRSNRGYWHTQAHSLVLFRRQSNPPPLIDAETWMVTEILIRQKWSPEQISRWMKKHLTQPISHECIYQHILTNKEAGGTLHSHLRGKEKREQHHGSHDRRGKLKNRISTS